MLIAGVLLAAWAALFAQGAIGEEIDRILDQGSAAVAAGNYPEIARLGADALRLSLESHDRQRAARSLLLVGSANYYQGRLLEALADLEHAERDAQDLHDIATERQAKRLIGNTLRQLGRFDDALHNFDDWFRLNRQSPRPEPEGPMVRTLCILYREMGDLDQAERACREATRLAHDSGDRRFEAAALLSLGAVLKDRRRFPEAIRFHDEALSQAEAAQAEDLRAEILNSLGDAYRQVGEPQKAASSFSAAVKVSHSLGYRGVEAQATERLGEIELSRGDGGAAVQSFARASSLYRENGDVPEKRFQVEHLWAQAERSSGHREEALVHYREAIGLLERLERFTVPTEKARAFPIAAGRAIFEEAVDLLFELDRPSEAFELSERGRARAFLDVLNDSKIDLRATLDVDQRLRETELMRALAASRSRQAEQDALNALEAFYLDLRRSNQAYSELKRPELATTERVQHELANRETVFVEYMLADKRSYAWVISADAFQLAILPPRNEIDRRVKAYRASIADSVTALTLRPSSRRKRVHGREMYRLLIGPFGESVRRAKHLLVATDGVLAYLPFEALLAPDGRFLIERCAISYSLSASASLQLRAKRFDSSPPTKALIAFGDAEYGTRTAGGISAGAQWTRLPSTRDEVLGISRLYSPEQRLVFVGSSATAARVKQEDLREYRYLHFAVHGLVDDDHPARSGLVLSSDGRSTDSGILRMEEIALLRSNAELVTLSACRTGVGPLLGGEGMMALSRAFFYAGARTVIGTLWDVNDQSTARLMKGLYAALNEHLRPEDALRQAKLRMLRGQTDLWRDPHFWAPFVVFQ